MVANLLKYINGKNYSVFFCGTAFPNLASVWSVCECNNQVVLGLNDGRCRLTYILGTMLGKAF